MLMGSMESSSVNGLVSTLSQAGQCKTVTQCSQMATAFAADSHDGPLNDLGGGLLVPSPNDKPEVVREVALQFLGDNFRELLAANPKLNQQFTEQLSNPTHGVIDLRKDYAIAFTYSMNKEAAKAGLIPDDYAQTTGEAIGTVAWNTLDIVDRWKLAGALNQCAACPQDIPQSPNRLIELIKIAGDVALVRGAASLGGNAVEKVAAVAKRSEDVAPALRLGTGDDDGLLTPLVNEGRGVKETSTVQGNVASGQGGGIVTNRTPNVSLIGDTSGFNALGIAVDPKASQQGRLLMQQYRQQYPDMTPIEIQRLARSTLETGDTLPNVSVAKPGDTFYKLIPTSEARGPSPGTVYWMDGYQLDDLMTGKIDIGSSFGLPNQTTASTYKVYQTSVKEAQAPLIFRSNIAPVVDDGIFKTGGQNQTLLPKRSAFSEPVQILNGNGNPLIIQSR